MSAKRLYAKKIQRVFEDDEALEIARAWKQHMDGVWCLAGGSEYYGHRVCQFVPVPHGIYNDACKRVLARVWEHAHAKFLFPYVAISASPDPRNRYYEARGEYFDPEVCSGCRVEFSSVVAVVLRGELAVHYFPRECKTAVTLTRTTKGSNAKPRDFDAVTSCGTKSRAMVVAAGHLGMLPLRSISRFRPQPTPGTLAFLFFATGTEAAFDRWAIRAYHGRLDVSVEAIARNGLRLYPFYESRLSDEAKRRMQAQKGAKTEDDVFFEVTRCPQPFPNKTQGWGGC